MIVATDWVGLVAAVASALAVLIPLIVTAAIKIIGAIHASHASLKQDLQLPSNGTTLGAGVEAIGQKQDLAIGLAHPDLNSPSFVQLARQLAPESAPERRATDQAQAQVPTPPPSS